MVAFDLSTKVIPSSHKIWALHAGRGKRQYETFKETSRIFLEVPGFFPSLEDFENLGNIRRFIRMSDAILRFTRGATITIPSRVSNSYSDAIASKENRDEKGLNSAVGNVYSLYKDASVGDLVIVPGQGQYKPVLIGEIQSPYSPDDAISLSSLNNEFVPTRRVRWINNSIEKRVFSKELAKRLENRHAIINIKDNVTGRDFSKFPLEVYRAVYESFILMDDSKVSFLGKKYNSRNPDGIIASTQVIRFLAAAISAKYSGQIDEFAQMSPDEAVQKFYDVSLVRDFTLNFNSPGKIDIVMRTLAAVVVGLAISAGVSGVSFSEVLDGVEILNFGSDDVDKSLTGCADFYRELMMSIGEDNYKYIADKCEVGNREIGLQTSIKKVD